MCAGEPGFQANTSLPCYQTMLANFESTYATTECEGEDAHMYNERWERGTDAYGHEQWYRVPVNISGCLSEEYCLGDDSWPRARFHVNDTSVTCAGEGQEQCFMCHEWGNECWPRGRRALCEITTFEHNATLCAAAGFTYLLSGESGHHDLCADLSITSSAECLPADDYINYHRETGAESEVSPPSASN